MQVYNFSGSDLEITTSPILFGEDSSINSIYINSDGDHRKLVYMNVYIDGTNLTDTMFLGYCEKSLLTPIEMSKLIFPTGSKVEFVIKQSVGRLDNIDMTVTVATGSGGSAVVGNSLAYHNGTLSIAASDSDTISLNESGSFFYLKSLLLDTINKNVTIDIEYNINGNKKLIKRNILNSLEEAFVYESNLITDGIDIVIYNNDTSNSITIDWNSVSAVY